MSDRRLLSFCCPGHINGKAAVSRCIHGPDGVLEWAACWWARFV